MIVLTYHAIDGSGSPIAVEPGRFADTIGRLVDAGLVAVDLGDWVARGRPHRERGFAVAFDDGLRSVLAGVEALERTGVPATIFVVTRHVGGDNAWPGQPGWVGRRAMLDWSEIDDLARRGFRFGAHTATHPRLDRLRPAEVEAELIGSRDAIEARLNRPCPLLAYPYGVSTQAVRERAGRAFVAAFGTRPAIASGESAAFDLPRVDGCYLGFPGVMERLIAGRLRPWLAVRRGLRAARHVARSIRPVGR